ITGYYQFRFSSTQLSGAVASNNPYNIVINAITKGGFTQFGNYNFSITSLCSLLNNLYIDQGNYGFFVESPQAEPNNVYINTNYLAYFVSKNLCNFSNADKIKNFLDRYPNITFYNYPQILIYKPIPYPLKLTNTTQVETIGNYNIKIEKLTQNDLYDFDLYVDLLFYVSLYFYYNNSIDLANYYFNKTLTYFDGKGFRDKAFKGLYDTYKISLALYVSKVLRKNGYINQFTNILNSISRFATKYDANLVGQGDYNLETLSITILALSDIPYSFPRISSKVSGTAEATNPSATIIYFLLLAIILKYFSKRISKRR
ncbi:MAG TPA: hypothetical protein VKU94_02775, partial [Geobacterales bacterium]|nr:hypothetical protein [Geobacterales bacterium]